MDLIAYALAKKHSQESGGGGSQPVESAITIGNNGNWFIKGIDTGLSADPHKNLVEVDGILKADTEKRNLVVLKDGEETIVGEYTSGIELSNITQLFEEE